MGNWVAGDNWITNTGRVDSNLWSGHIQVGMSSRWVQGSGSQSCLHIRISRRAFKNMWTPPRPVASESLGEGSEQLQFSKAPQVIECVARVENVLSRAY